MLASVDEEQGADDELGETLVSSDLGDGLVEEILQLERGDIVGRYVILEEIGAGAMGVVYAAYDPQLDRKLALKIMRVRTGDDPGTQDASASSESDRVRMLREAQALARLSHPNVVTVHDVGSFGDRVFVAMAFIDGRTLGDWIAQTNPDLARILEVFVQAGRGLAAAHAASLVHRDFKPDNVILGQDGSVTVLDFGLAREAGQADATLDEPEFESLTGSRRSLSIELTRAGRVMGTPAYMAPEQHLGLPAGARSDQFAFCVALYEALYGERPFEGDSLQTLMINATEGNVRGEPEGTVVPKRIRKVLLRGLASDPDARHPDMEALLDELGSEDRPRKSGWTRGVIAAVAAVLGVGAGAAVLGGAERSENVCGGGEARARAVWSQQRRAAARRSFEASKLPYARHAWERVDGSLDALVSDWAGAHREACEATRVRREQSQEMLDRKMLCLEGRLRSYGALAERFEGADAKTVEHSVEAVDALEDVASCADPHTLLGQSETLDEDRRREVDELDSLIARARALEMISQIEDGREVATAALERARAVEHSRTLIDALSVAAELETDREDYDKAVALRTEAVRVADASGDDLRRAKEAMALIPLYGTAMQRPKQARTWASVARGAIERVGSPPEYETVLAVKEARVVAEEGQPKQALPQAVAALERLEEVHGRDSAAYDVAATTVGIIAREAGELAEAERIQREGLRSREHRLGPDHPEVGAALGSLANVMHSQGRYREAVALNKRALEIIEQTHGIDSPAYIRKLNNYAAGLSRIGELDEAERMHLLAIAYVEKTYGADDAQLAPRLENLGTVYSDAARWEDARRTIERARDIKAKALGPEHPSTAISMMNLAVALHHLGRNEEAAQLLEETLKIWTEALGEDHVDLGIVLTNLGMVKSAQGRHETASKHHQRALDLFEAAWGEDSADLGYPLTGLGIAHHGRGDVQASLAAFARATKLRQGEFIPGHERVRMEYGYAKALREVDADQAKRWAARAEATAREAGLPIADEIREWGGGPG